MQQPDLTCMLADTRMHSLEETGVFLYRLGLSTRPVSTSTVYEIERRALDKIRKAIKCTAQR